MNKQELRWYVCINHFIEPESLAKNHAHVNVLQVKNSNGKVSAENADQEDDVSLDILEHEGDSNHLNDQH